MSDHRAGGEGFDRRVGQLRGCLDPMHHRSTVVARDACFIVFSEGTTPAPESKGFLATVSGWFGGGAPGRPNDRFVQFMFSEEGFLMDLPSTVLSEEEAREIVDGRPGFVQMGESGPSPYGSGGGRFEPLQKSYTYGQEGEAADDAAFVLFGVWKLPVDRRLHVSAASVGTDHAWEQDEPLE